MMRYAVEVYVTKREAFVVEAKNVEDAEHKACVEATEWGVVDTRVVGVECLDDEQQYDVVLTMGTKAKTAEEAFRIAREMVASGKGFYVEVNRNREREVDAAIEDINWEGGK